MCRVVVLALLSAALSFQQSTANAAAILIDDFRTDQQRVTADAGSPIARGAITDNSLPFGGRQLIAISDGGIGAAYGEVAGGELNVGFDSFSYTGLVGIQYPALPSSNPQPTNYSGVDQVVFRIKMTGMQLAQLTFDVNDGNNAAYGIGAILLLSNPPPDPSIYSEQFAVISDDAWTDVYMSLDQGITQFNPLTAATGFAIGVQVLPTDADPLSTGVIEVQSIALANSAETQVPEPGSAALLMTGLGMLALIRRQGRGGARLSTPALSPVTGCGGV